VDPTNPQAMYQRGLLLLARKRPGEAVAELQAAREAAPAEPGVLVTLGKALRAAGRLSDAVEAWNTALALTRSDKDAVLIRNLLATAQGPPSDADDELIF
jgi:Flp pilus assembly protein TadD